jgi:hypothetical protein
MHKFSIGKSPVYSFVSTIVSQITQRRDVLLLYSNILKNKNVLINKSQYNGLWKDILGLLIIEQ